jgi:RNA polymerase sigma factor (sigma-70 family)
MDYPPRPPRQHEPAPRRKDCDDLSAPDRHARVTALVLRAKNGDRQAVSELVDQFHWMIWGLSEKIIARGSEQDDLCQQGFFVLRDAINAWSPDGGANFTTYLYRGLLLRLGRCAREEGVIRIPDYERGTQVKKRRSESARRTRLCRKNAMKIASITDSEVRPAVRLRVCQGDHVSELMDREELQDKVELIRVAMLRADLTDFQLDVFIRNRVEGIPCRELGEERGVSHVAIASAVKRAIAKIRRAVELIIQEREENRKSLRAA